jgi:hypothetical protein
VVNHKDDSDDSSNLPTPKASDDKDKLFKQLHEAREISFGLNKKLVTQTYEIQKV